MVHIHVQYILWTTCHWSIQLHVIYYWCTYICHVSHAMVDNWDITPNVSMKTRRKIWKMSLISNSFRWFQKNLFLRWYFYFLLLSGICRSSNSQTGTLYFCIAIVLYQLRSHFISLLRIVRWFQKEIGTSFK